MPIGWPGLGGDEMGSGKSKMIDADGHVLERLELSPEVREAFFARIRGDEPISADDPAPAEASHAELMNRPGASEPGPRLVDMDAEGIDVAVLYPTTPGLAWVPEADVFHEMAREYNRWLHDVLRVRPDPPRRGRAGGAAGPETRRPRRWSAASRSSDSRRS